MNAPTLPAELPQPLVPAEVDLRDFGFMPLDIIRLFGSRFHAIASDAEWRAGVTLWAKSFHQVPAASLPDDDVELCRLAELGRDVKTWKRLRANAMHGWVLCSDGRWYHPVVSEKANEAWSRKRVARERSAKGNAKRWGYRDDPSHESGRIEGSSEECKNDPSSLQEGSHKESLKDRKGQGQGQGDIHPSGVVASKPRPSRKPPPDFALTPEIRAWAAEHAPQVDADAELAKMLDHTFATARTDWPGTLRNWLRKAQEDAQRERPRHAANGSAPEPQWRTEQRARTEAFAGPAAAKRTDDTEHLEALHAAPRLG